MGERKVINKYFPPDFDPSKIPRGKKANLNPNFVVRMMLPMSVRCNTCGEYMYKGKKFNSRKEDVDGPDGEYLGIKILRFYFKCITCSAEFTIKTDPKNMDYAVEAGVRRNFELYKAEEKEKSAAVAARAESEKDDPMAQLENKTKDSKMEMDILDALDEIRTQNARSASLNADAVLLEHRRTTAERAAAAAAGPSLDDEDELELRRAFAAQRQKRLRDDDDGDCVGEGCEPADVAAVASSSGRRDAHPLAPPLPLATAAPSKRPRLPPGLVVHARAKAAATSTRAPVAAPAPSPAAETGTLLGLGAYASGSGSGSAEEDA